MREKIELTNCLSSTVTISNSSDTRYIPKDYFIAKNQKRYHEIRQKNPTEWDVLYDEVMREIENDLVVTMM